MTDEKIIARMQVDQEQGWPLCPRCGQRIRIDAQTRRAAASNALSRQVDVYMSAMTAAPMRRSARLWAYLFR